MAKVLISDLEGTALDWAVATCLEVPHLVATEKNGKKIAPVIVLLGDTPYLSKEVSYSTNWAQGGPIIERENIFTYPSDLLGHGFGASKWKLPVDVKVGNEFICKTDYAPTRLVAAMRCFVASRFKEELIEVPDELAQTEQKIERPKG